MPLRKIGLGRLLPLVAGLLLIPACLQSVVDLIIEGQLSETQRLGTDPGARVYEPQAFVNWESGHVSPLAMTSDGGRLLAVNTADNRLEVFDLSSGTPVSEKRIAVGLEPVSVRLRTDREAWVVNHISDSVSIVDLDAGNIVRTLTPGDEPSDVAFAAGRAFVTCTQLDQVTVYNLADLSAAPAVLPLKGGAPRMAAASRDGARVYVAFFESGNATTIIPAAVVSDPSGPYGGVNPPPNLADSFSPPMAEGLPKPPISTLIVRKSADGAWLDGNGVDWSEFVTWDVLDHDLAVIDAATLEIGYVERLMTTDMALTVRGDGAVTVVGTEARNDVRFEPNVNGDFVRTMLAIVRADAAPGVVDLNPHLEAVRDAGIRTLPAEERSRSLADPRAVAWSSDGAIGYVAGLGSNNVARIRADGSRIDQIDVGEGPTGLVVDEARGAVYVLNRFSASISVLNASSYSEVQRVAFFDPTPAVIRDGRKFLYDARLTSGLGTASCAGCHLDGKMDGLAWDLGDPSGAVKPFDGECESAIGDFLGTTCADFHPMKGPMTTQTLQGTAGVEPLHWRGDRRDLAEFNGAYLSLLGNDRMLTDEEMAAFQAFVRTLSFPPNPNRNLDNSLKTELDGANPVRGRELYLTEPIDSPHGVMAPGGGKILTAVISRGGPVFSCNHCHQLPEGTNRKITSAEDLGRAQGTKVPQLRNSYRKRGFSKGAEPGYRGFGFAHTGEFPTAADLLSLPNFDFGPGDEGIRRRSDIVAFVMSMSTDTHAGMGMQATLRTPAADDPTAAARIDLMLQLADSGDVGLVVHGVQGGAARGYAYIGGGVFQADRAGETISASELRDAAKAGAELTWTIVPHGSEQRVGIDADGDGVLNGDATSR